MTELNTVIVGTKYLGAAAVRTVAMMRPGMEVALRREDHKYDHHAIQCHFYGVQVGYIPKIVNPPVALSMDRGQTATAFVTAAADICGDKVRVEPKIIVRYGE